MREPHPIPTARLHPAPAPRPRMPARPAPLGRLLVERGAITQDQLVRALHLQLRLNAPIGEILVAEGYARNEDVQGALADQFGLERVNLAVEPPDPALARLRPPQFWLRHGAVPWRRRGPVLFVATARPDRFEQLCEALDDIDAAPAPVLAPEDEIQRAIARAHGPELARAASTRTPQQFSCRSWTPARRLPMSAAAGVVIAALALRPDWALAVVVALTFLSLALFSALRLAGFLAHLASHGHLTAPDPSDNPDSPPGPPAFLPKVSILVPLYREHEIATTLIRRLERLTYPKALLEVILILERSDDTTRATLEGADLPPWMRIIEVPPDGGLTTKPRAMNYALDFCRGEIIGVWDAEDAPQPDQIERVVAHFARAPRDVACLQGILDFYNPRSNWRARCFTIEYSGWFRVLLHGIARLGLVVPLGGTTMFVRRPVLEEVGGWDAHNVTEDAELGLRLARAGWRTEVIDTVTFEEANHRAWPWVKQRSRWLKGFMVTWLVHMRRPLALWRDLGTLRFLGVQAFFLGTLGQFLLAPVLWSFWPMTLGLPHPAQGIVPQGLLNAAVAMMVGIELLGLAVGFVAVSASHRRFLIPWLPSMMFYYPLGAVAAYKALMELCLRPHFWDKTRHGQAPAETRAEALAEPQLPEPKTGTPPKAAPGSGAAG